MRRKGVSKKLVSLSVILAMVFLLANLGPFPVKAAIGKRAVWVYTLSTNDTVKANLEKLNGAVDVVAPDWYSVDTSGIVKEEHNNGTMSRADLVKWAHSQGIKVVPLVQDASGIGSLLADPNARNNIINQIMNYVNTLGLDGIQIDFENLTGSDKDALNAFMQELTNVLHANGKISSIAVLWKSSDTEPSWNNEFDYRFLGQVVDTVTIMTYDYHSSNSSPGPGAPYAWVDDVANYASTTIPSNKVLLGIPFYGRDWVVGGPYIGAVNYTNAVNKANSVGAPINWVETNNAVWLTSLGHDQKYKDKPVYGKYFNYTDGSGTHEVWFEDASTLAPKLDLIDKYNLGGTAAWKLGDEDPAVWGVIQQKLQPILFDDIRTHWGKYEINYLANQGIVGGYPDGTYKPDNKVTRAELAKMLVMAMKLPTDNVSSSLSDVGGHWAYSYIAAAQNAGVITGYGDGTFKPDKTASRAEVATMMVRAFQAKFNMTPSGNIFRDVKQNHWAYNYIHILRQNNITNGFPDGSFKPENTTTRAEVAAFISRALQK